MTLSLIITLCMVQVLDINIDAIHFSHVISNAIMLKIVRNMAYFKRRYIKTSSHWVLLYTIIASA